MATRSTEKEIIELERRYWQALKDNDMDTAIQLSDNPCIITGPQGVGSVDHKAMREMAASAPYKLNDFQLDKDMKVLVLNDDAAVVAYKVKEDFTVDGKRVVLEAAESSTWVRRNGRWVCALHTEALTGDPFGRDRKPQQASS